MVNLLFPLSAGGLMSAHFNSTIYLVLGAGPHEEGPSLSPHLESKQEAAWLGQHADIPFTWNRQ